VVGKILDKEQYNYGFDAQNGEYGNLMTKGIIDPTRGALRPAGRRLDRRPSDSRRGDGGENAKKQSPRRRCRRAAEWTTDPHAIAAKYEKGPGASRPFGCCWGCSSLSAHAHL